MSGADVGATHFRGEWNDYAFVDGGSPRERLDAVYIQNAALKKWGSADEAWMATLTILHELSHRVPNTKDAVYDFTGLQPSAVLTFKHAIVDADSWAYVAADLNGQLPESARQKYETKPASLRAAYLKTVTT